MKEYEWERGEKGKLKTKIMEKKNDNVTEGVTKKRTKKIYRQRAKHPSITCLHALHPSASC